jgi:glycosyltransferase involved in cell wall biosynthesis
MAPVATRVKTLFVNSGILGQQTFSKYIGEAMGDDPDIEARHIDLSKGLTFDERVLRRAMCVRLWPDGLWGLKNLDLARLRHEYHAGVQAARRMRPLNAGWGAQVIHFHRQATAYASLRTLRRLPSIVSIDSTQDAVMQDAGSSLERWSYMANARVDGMIFRRSSSIVATSEWAASAVRRRYPDCGTPIHIMPSPVRLRFFDERWIDERTARAAAGARPRVLFVGGDFVRKGGEDLLAVWRGGELHRVAHLDLVTDWRVDVSGVPGVRLMPRVLSYSPEWIDAWRRADIFVLPSRSEAFASVFLEAGAAGLPAVGPRLNAIPEIIEDGVTGVLSAVGDRQALLRSLQVLLESPERRRTLGRAARARIVSIADPDRYARRLREIIKAAHATGRGPGQ